MRQAFVEELLRSAEADERIWLLTGDLGFSVLEPFIRRFPRRFVNAGVAEQNMTGMAAGLALSGKIVFTYSIANFPILRCLEQIRNDVCYHNANVKIVAVGGGLAYGAQGYTHHGVEDLAILRVLPNLTVIAPGDPVETRLAVRAMAGHAGPCYLRLGKSREPVVHKTEPPFAFGRSIPMRQGRDTLFITTGAVLELAVRACDRLAEDGLQPGLISMPTVQPLGEAAVLQAAAGYARIVTVEEHGRGGLASAVGELLARRGCRVAFQPLYLKTDEASGVGDQESLCRARGVSFETLIASARSSASI